jgi:hypothetical protein
MANLKVEKPKKFSEFISLIENLRKSSGSTLWYRGCGNSNYKLIPSLYRHKTIKKIETLVENEYRIMTWFRERSMPFHDKPLDNDLEALFFMQHYGIPTRLLDWTENPLIALFFAVNSARYEYDNGKRSYQSQASVWVLDPVEWNSVAVSVPGFEKKILSTNDDEIRAYLPVKKFNFMQSLPAALYGIHNSPRIVAQRGVFVVFGKETLPIEDQFKRNGFPDNCLVKIVLLKSVIDDLRDSILSSGITESVVYPDLEGLAQETKRKFNYGD